jgi:hypothetical protein
MLGWIGRKAGMVDKWIVEVDIDGHESQESYAKGMLAGLVRLGCCVLRALGLVRVI